jgi:pyruvate kinase
MASRRVKIVCTIGPASDSEDTLVQLITAGMDVARLNFSHGSHEEHARRFRAVRNASARCGRPVAILQDLCGPKIRVGRVPGGPRPVPTGDELVLVEGLTTDIATALPIQYEGLAEDVRPDDELLLDDGRVALRVLRVEGGRVVTRVVQGGGLRDKMGVHIPARRVRLSAVTEKDKADLSFGLSIGVDYVALSFVRKADDMRLVRDICEAWGRPVPLVAKIETPQAVDDIDAITAASDAVMVARGDLGVELSPERVPIEQKRIIEAARRHQRPVIVATEMLQSMVSSTRPTRAEATDVANAVFEGTDCVMLSGETASGDHPVLACAMMARIVREAETSPYYRPNASEPHRATSVAEAVARNAADIANELGARLIVTFTESGDSARLVSKARPRVPIVAFATNERTRGLLALYWGVISDIIEPSKDVDQLVDRANGYLLARGLASPGDRFVVVFGAPLGVRGTTNSIRVRVVE